MSGFVWLVGAGPGDPDLLTRRAARVLERAQLVLYDALVSTDVLDLAPRAQRFYVGKRAGRPAIRQETIHRLMIRAARRGRLVVRLKGGDPFVFGRGGEEALALAGAGVAFEVVPGITSAVAAPALSGIPLTHRGLATAVLVVAGHAETAWEGVLGTLLPHSATLVVLMGLASRDALSGFLLGRGWRAGTPAAICWAAGTRRARTWTGTLAGLAAAVTPDENRGDPGTIVVGEVVSLAETLGKTESPVVPALAAGQAH